MGRAIAILSGAAKAPLMPLTRPLARLAHTLRHFIAMMTDDYRPERHYMRGPGPAWRRKHGGPNR
jgi:hypothetical protein